MDRGHLPGQILPPCRGVGVVLGEPARVGVSPRAGTESPPPPAGVRSRQEVCWALSRRGDRAQPWPVSKHAYKLSEGGGGLGCKQAL